MTGSKILQVSGKAMVLQGDDIDTDQIIPARFLKEITFSNLGKYPFYDERFDSNGNLKDHPFNKEEYQKSSILLVNKNFGCGSSREHAPQSLLRWGIKAVVGESFAEIFAGNCVKLGIPAVKVNENHIKTMQEKTMKMPTLEWTIDLVTQSISGDSGNIQLELPEQHRKALMNGTWDSTDLLLGNMNLVQQLSEKLPYLNSYSN